ncbi:TonB-dependent receptor domain-containing protein [Albirhodobacter sp. R86504]|uniref:TonB-dependent receptor domain-containing protein n=1 Tax=Albirhodobacter sp. R86504 TaxID=3093848 RepID=UPI00366FBD63
MRFPPQFLPRLLPLAGTSLLAMTAALHAQEAETFALDPITIIREGEDNITATGGTVLTLGDIETLAPADVSQLFSRNSSISVSGGGGPAKKIHVLGMEQSNLAVSVDGVPQPATSWHHTGSNVVDPKFLKRVEVEAGAAAADSGFAAAAGAIRYETVGAQDLLEDGQTTGGRASVSYGSNGAGLTTSLAGYGKYAGFDWFVMANESNGDNYETGDGVEVLGTEPAATNVIAKLGYEVEDHRFEVNFEHGRDAADRTIKMNLGLSTDTTAYPMVVTRDSISLKYTTTNATNSWDPEATLYFSENDYYRDNYTTSTNGNMQLEEDTFGGKVQNTFTTGMGKITAGVDFKQHDYFTNNYGNNDRQYRNFSTSQIGVFTQGRFDLGQDLSLSTGARYDASRFTDWDGERFSSTGGSVNGTLAYKVTEGLELFAGASSTYLGYVIGDYGYLHARDSSFYTDPGFDTGRSQNVKLGANFTQNDFRGGITFFDTKINGQPSYGWSPAVLTNDPDEYRTRGFTLNGNYDFGGTRVGGTLTKADVTIGGESAVPSSGYFMPIGTMATLYVDHDLVAYNMTVGASVEWASEISDTAATDAGFVDQPSYTVLSAYAEWQPARFDTVSVRLDVDNLLDETYYERTGYAYSTNRGGIDPIYAAGRTVTLGVTMKF